MPAPLSVTFPACKATARIGTCLTHRECKLEKKKKEKGKKEKEKGGREKEEENQVELHFLILTRRA
jgi:hypothetical protein